LSSFVGGGGSSADTVTVAAVEGEGRLFQRLVDDYVTNQIDVEVDVTLFPYANLFEKTSSVLSTEGTSFDILFMDDPWFPQFATHCAPLRDHVDSLPEDQLIDTTVDIATWPAPKGPVVPSAEGMDETIRGQVVVGNTQLFAYNESYYEEVGMDEPQTWEDVYEAGSAISEQIDGANGYIIRGKRGNPINANFFGLGNSRIGDMFDENWRYQWASDRGVDTLDFYVNDLKSISPDGVASFDSDRILNSLADGSAAQAPAWPAAASLLLDPEEAEEADNISFTVLPEGTRRAPQQGNWIAAINSYVSDEKKSAAGDVIQEAISKEAQNRYVELGGVPFRHDTFEDNMDAQPWFPALYESLQTAKWRPRTPLWSEVAVTQGENLNSALTGEISPSEALANIQEDVEGTFEEAGYY
jgi:multiple sugar transport system substrate-binding protein